MRSHPSLVWIFVDVSKNEHFGDVSFARRIEAAFGDFASGVEQGAKEPIDEGKVCVVHGVPIALVMNAEIPGIG